MNENNTRFDLNLTANSGKLWTGHYGNPPCSGTQSRQLCSSWKRCFCNLSWCNRLVHGELDSGGKGYPYGGMNLPKGRPELRSWLTHLGCTDRGADGDPWWTPERVSACVANPRQAPFAFDKMKQAKGPGNMQRCAKQQLV